MRQSQPFSWLVTFSRFEISISYNSSASIGRELHPCTYHTYPLNCPHAGLIAGVVVAVLVLLASAALVFAGILVACWSTRHRKSHPPVPVNAYEEVEVPNSTRHTEPEIKLDDNVAYGHFR